MSAAAFRDLPAPEDVAVRALIERNAEVAPSALAVAFEDDTRWTWSDMAEEMHRSAAALAARGLERGDRMVLMAANGADYLRAWFGASALGAVIVPINPALHGPLLSHALEVTSPALVAVSDETRPTAAAVTEAGLLVDIVSLADGPAAQIPPIDPPLLLEDPHSVVMTSGTTGPSKGVVQHNLQVYVMGLSVTAEQGMGEEDVLLVDLALFHSATLIAVVGCITTRTAIALRTRPDLSRFWETIRDTGATMAYCVSSADKLMARPPSPAEREHSLRVLLAAPLPTDTDAFIERFGVPRLATTIGQSEGGAFAGIFEGTPLRGTSCGPPRPGFTVRLVDESDVEVPQGTAGEMVVRHEWPWVISTEYLGNAEATARAWRNGWFHTGDLAIQDADGYLTFHDRAKDAIRRRGENISSYEVESIALRHPQVRDAACVAHEEPGQETEVKLFVVAEADLDLRDVFLHCVREMPRWMVPRYFEPIAELPRTPPPTNRVQKEVLRRLGTSGVTWDRTTAGFDGSASDLERLRIELTGGAGVEEVTA